MARYRNSLPQLCGTLFLTDGGIETTLIFHEGLQLPHFAAFDLLKTKNGEDVLRRYFQTYADIAQKFGAGLILESPTWRGSADWGAMLGYNSNDLAEANHKAIYLLTEIRHKYETERTPVVISGCVGPRRDGYIPDQIMSAPEAQAYHQKQINVFADSDADMVCAITMNYVEEALGISKSAQQALMPVAISFTVETDGNLPTGQSLKSAIEQIDDATSGYPQYYMINCAHPTHFEHALDDHGLWLKRIRGIRANASCKSHSELNDSIELDIGNPAELAMQYANLKKSLPYLNVMGGCCGTDHRHVKQIAMACSPLFSGCNPHNQLQQ